MYWLLERLRIILLILHSLHFPLCKIILPKVIRIFVFTSENYTKEKKDKGNRFLTASNSIFEGLYLFIKVK